MNHEILVYLHLSTVKCMQRILMLFLPSFKQIAHKIHKLVLWLEIPIKDDNKFLFESAFIV